MLSVEPTWLEIMKRQIGVREVPGAQSHPQIVAYHESTNLKRRAAQRDETPWCSSVVNWVLEQSGYEGTDSAMARSWLSWGMELTHPWRGAITIIRRKGGGADSATGSWSGYHVAFFAGDMDTLRLLGGNQSDQVKHSVYSLDRYDVLGFRWPVVRANRA